MRVFMEATLKVKVTPKARKEGIEGYKGDELVIKVTEPPEKGRANERVIKLLAKKLQIAPSRIRLLRGETSRHKLFCIEGVSQKDLEQLHDN